MPIFHRKNHANFTTVPNELLNDESLSFEARGMLAYLLAKPADWTVRAKDLMRAGGCGKDKIYRMLNELLDARYVIAETPRSAIGRFEYMEYHVHDHPLPENPEAVKPDAANPPLTKDLPIQKTEDRLSKARVPTLMREDWEVQPDNLAKLVEKYPNIEVEGEVDGFKDYWLSRGTTKADWQAAFRNWVRLTHTRQISDGAKQRTNARRLSDKVTATVDSNRERAARAMDRLADIHPTPASNGQITDRSGELGRPTETTARRGDRENR